MWSHEKRIYRGIPLKFMKFPLTVSAVRDNEIAFLEHVFLDNFGEKLFQEYKEKIRVSSQIPFFSKISPISTWAWFLASVHIGLEVKKNPLLLSPLKYPSVITAFENFTRTEKHQLPKQAYEITCGIFGECENYDEFMQRAISNTSASNMVYGFEYFQHLNYDIRGNLNYNPFPTMVMDWTYDVTIADSFSYLNGEAGIVISIDYNKYKKLLYDEWYAFGMDEGVAATLPGFTPYFDYNFLFSKKNINMQKQKGVVLFWPWDYTIEELETNELGEKLGFVKIPIL